MPDAPATTDDLLADISTAAAAPDDSTPPKKNRGKKPLSNVPAGMTSSQRKIWIRTERAKLRASKPRKPRKPKDLSPGISRSKKGEVSAEYLLTGEGIPWANLPDSTDITADVQWVYNSYSLVVKERPGGESVLKWDQASRPPSKGAVTWMLVASANRQKFFSETAIKVLLGEKTGEDSAQIKQEKIDVAEIEKQLAKLLEAKDG
jgi:hypothetical protein